MVGRRVWEVRENRGGGGVGEDNKAFHWLAG